MCSINGFTWSDEDLVRRMNKETAHRGPDGTGTFVASGISLGHNRLAIIDLSPAASQPMKSACGRFVITFNGEIYNYLELRKELKDYPFKSDSDTEVILNAYAEYGVNCVSKLNGIFAFAIWDSQKKELFLARDHNGVKPLYYFWNGEKLIFSSEIKAILAHGILREVDEEAFNLYMRVLYVPEPYTMFKGIKKLPPAHYAILNGSSFSIKKYWEVSDFSNIPSREEATEGISKIFRDSVKRQLISDRPVGVFLSGGIDSSAVLGAVAEIAPGKVKTYSVGFNVDVQSEKFNADLMLAEKTARHYHADHHALMISGKDVGKELQKIAWHLDEPNANPTAGAIYLLSQMAKKDVAVVLGGDGADELFGGYRRYFLSGTVRRLSRIPGAALALSLVGKGGVTERLREDTIGLFLSFLSQKEDAVSTVLNPEMDSGGTTRQYFRRYFEGVSLHGDVEKHYMNTDRQSWLIDESLLRSDKMTMAFGLEERVPILDHRLAELAYKIPTKWKIKDGGWRQESFQGKRIWKEAVSAYLPEHVLHEQKRGWFTPMAKWVRTDLREQVSEILSPSHLNHEFFNVQEVEKMWRNHLESRKYNLNLIWAVVMWQLWYDTFIRNS